MFDIVLISYDEENAQENWKELVEKFPTAKRVHGVQGIHLAHNQAASLATTDFFYTIDGDNQLIEDFHWKTPETLRSGDIYVWRCLNAVNGLVYGYGGLKLWSRDIFTHEINHFGDHATERAKRYCVVNELATKTIFNTSPYSAWKSGLREGAKLTYNIQHNKDPYCRNRLDIWLSVGAHSPHGLWTILGARQGHLLAMEQDWQTVADRINYFDQLKSWFAEVEELGLEKELAKVTDKITAPQIMNEMESQKYADRLARRELKGF